MTHNRDPRSHRSSFDFMISVDRGKIWTRHATGLSVEDVGKQSRHILSNNPTARVLEPGRDYEVKAGKVRWLWRGECEDCSGAEVAGWHEDHQFPNN